MLALLPTLAMLASDGPPSRLADALASADSVDSVRADPAHHAVTFTVDRAGESYEIVVHTGPRGAVADVTVRDAGRGHVGLGALSWLVDAMHASAAVVRLQVDAEGAVTLTTDDGTRYLAIPGGGARSNDAVEARWGGEWNNS